jgi:hypothetical protein
MSASSLLCVYKYIELFKRHITIRPAASNIGDKKAIFHPLPILANSFKMHAFSFLSLASALPTVNLTISGGDGIIDPTFVVPDGLQLVNINGTWALSDFNGSTDMSEIAAMVKASLKEMGLDDKTTPLSTLLWDSRRFVSAPMCVRSMWTSCGAATVTGYVDGKQSSPLGGAIQLAQRAFWLIKISLFLGNWGSTFSQSDVSCHCTWRDMV